MNSLKYIICIFLLQFSFSANAQSFRTTVSVLGNLNNGKYNFVEKNGIYDTKNNSFNLGLGINTSFYPIKEENWYLSLGIRVNTTEASIYTANQILGTIPFAAPIKWGYRWQAITIPIHVGKTIVPLNESKFNMDIYGGISLGFIMESMSSYEVSFINSSTNNDQGVFHKRDLMTFDLGFNLTPITALPQFSLGFAFVYNIQATKEVKGGGYDANIAQPQEYYFNFNRRFNNYTFSINYSFGKRNFERKQNKLGCYKRI